MDFYSQITIKISLIWIDPYVGIFLHVYRAMRLKSVEENIKLREVN